MKHLRLCLLYYSLVLISTQEQTTHTLNEIVDIAVDEIGDVLGDTLGFDDCYGYRRVNACHALMQIAPVTKGKYIIQNKIAVSHNPIGQFVQIKSQDIVRKFQSIIFMVNYQWSDLLLKKKKIAQNPSL